MLRLTKFVTAAAIAVTSVTSVTTATVAGAQMTAATRPISIGASAGAAVPIGDLRDAVDLGYSLNGHVGIALPALPISLRGDVGYNRWGIKDIEGTAINGDVHVWSFTGNAVFTLPLESSMIRPYAIGGIGAYRFAANVEGQGDHDDTRFGFNVGGGIAIPLSGFNTFIEARYNRVNTQGGSTSYVPITFGVMF